MVAEGISQHAQGSCELTRAENRAQGTFYSKRVALVKQSVMCLKVLKVQLKLPLDSINNMSKCQLPVVTYKVSYKFPN